MIPRIPPAGTPAAAGPAATPVGAVDLCVLGQPFGVRGDAAVVTEVGRLLDWFIVPPGGRDDRPVVCVRRYPDGFAVTVQAGAAGRDWPDGATDGKAGDVAGAAVQVLAVLNAAALAGPGCLTVHAGVVARAGRAVAFPAGSGQGKSTLTAACLRAGLDYVSDEALCVDWWGAGVLPYPRPLELSRWSRAAAGLPAGPGDGPGGPDRGTGDASPGNGLVGAAELGAELARPPLLLDHVVLPSRHADTGRSEVTLDPVPPQQAAAALLSRSFNHWRDPDRAFDLVHEVASHARVWQLRLGDPARAAALIGNLLA